jgi:hypothetical protein
LGKKFRESFDKGELAAPFSQPCHRIAEMNPTPQKKMASFHKKNSLSEI